LGNFVKINGVSRRAVARFLADGQLDATFVDNPEISSIDSAAVQPDGKMLLAGYVKNINYESVLGMIRLTTNGIVDPSFNSSAYHGKILALQSDGKILTSGVWKPIVGNALQRINADGSIDPSFHVGSEGLVDQAVLTEGGKILVRGSFTGLGGVSRDRLGRVPNNTAALHSLTMPNASEIFWQRDGSAPALRIGQFEIWNGSSWAPLGAGVPETGGWRLTGITVGQAGYIRARGESSSHVSGSSTGISVTDELVFNFTGGPLSAVQRWRIDYFGRHDSAASAGNDQDFDNDGASNLLEYAFATDPRERASRPHLTLATETTDNVGYLKASWERAGHPEGVLVIAEFSENLLDWDDASDRVSVLANTAELLSLRMTIARGRGFLRLRVVEE